MNNDMLGNNPAHANPVPASNFGVGGEADIERAILASMQSE